MNIIGLIDDEESQLKAIRRTIKYNAGLNEDYGFKAYQLAENTERLVSDVYTEVMKDIIEKKIASLIIDYKIMVRTTKIKGTDILERIKDQVPKFPVIVLTEVVEESIQPLYVDADKVYKKKEFFVLDSDYSKEKVSNIFDSMHKYVEQRDKLSLDIEKLKEDLAEGKVDKRAIGNILSLESRLDEFVPTDQTQIDKVFDVNKVRSIVELIDKANQMLE